MLQVEARVVKLGVETPVTYRHERLKKDIWNYARGFQDPLQKNNAFTRERHRLVTLWKIVFDIDPENVYKDGD